MYLKHMVELLNFMLYFMCVSFNFIRTWWCSSIFTLFCCALFYYTWSPPSLLLSPLISHPVCESSFFIRIILHFFKPFVLLFFFLFVFPFLWQEFHTCTQCTVYSIFLNWLNWCTVQDLKNFLVNTQSSLQSYPLIMKIRVLLAFFCLCHDFIFQFLIFVDHGS